MSTEYDFYTMGIRYAKDQIVNLKEMAKKIGEQYGADAKMEFESGICMTIPSYKAFQEIEEFSKFDGRISKNHAEKATVNYEARGINNSYLGGHGVGKRL